MHELGLESEDAYIERLRGATSRLVEAELRNLLNLVTVTETCFFRDASQFRLLREHIIPRLVSERRRVRIWSAGCSSGEEAYSIAIMLDDMGLFRPPHDTTFEITGTDLNSHALESARRGVYSPRAVRNVEGRLLDQYFVRAGNEFSLRDDVRRRVTFEFGNLNQTPMPSTGPQDVVFCKNVAIYFRSEVARRLICGLRDTIAPGGYLLLGHAESLWQMSEGFTLVEHNRAFCYRKNGNDDSPSVESVERYLGRGPKVVVHEPVVAGFSRTVMPANGATQRGVRLKPDPTRDEQADYGRCLAAFHAGDWDTAESSLLALVESCPTFVPAHLLLGGLYANRGRFSDAVDQAEAVLQLSELEARAHLLLGMIAARQQRSDDALLSLRRALYLDDSLALGHFWLGNIYRDRGDIVRACQEFENVVRDWEHRTLRMTEEFATDLTVEQLVRFCRESLRNLNDGKR
jgi:chemotaxis protein methyltransferase CheR